MNFRFAASSHAIKMLPTLAAAMAFSLLAPTQPAAAGGFTDSTIVVRTGVVLAPADPVAYPDLRVSTTKVVSSKYCVGFLCVPYSHEVELTINVWNAGAGPSAATEVDVNGSRHGVPALAPGVLVRIHLPVQDCGFFMVYVDPDHRIPESNEGNNWTQTQCA